MCWTQCMRMVTHTDDNQWQHFMETSLKRKYNDTWAVEKASASVWSGASLLGAICSHDYAVCMSWLPTQIRTDNSVYWNLSCIHCNYGDVCGNGSSDNSNHKHIKIDSPCAVKHRKSSASPSFTFNTIAHPCLASILAERMRQDDGLVVTYRIKYALNTNE